MSFTRCSSSKEALTTFIYYSILRNFRPTCLRASSRVCCYFWLMTSSAVGLFVLARVTSLFFVSSCSMRVCDDLNTGILIICCVCSCPGVLAGTWGWCDFLFPILLICVFSVWHWLRLKRVINSGLIFFCTITYRSP